MAVEVEQVALDQRFGDVVADAVTEALVLIVVDEAVVDVMLAAAAKIDGGMTPAGRAEHEPKPVDAYCSPADVPASAKM